MYLRLIMVTLFSVVVAWGCSESNFQGDAARAPAKEKDVADKGLGGPDGKIDGADGGNDDDPTDTSENDADETDDDGGEGDDGGDETENEGDGDTDRTIFDKITDIFNSITGSDPGFEQPDDETVIFGGKKVFHIGDGAYENSSCKSQIDTFALKGTQYYFEFEVLDDDTELDIGVNTICGVDYEDSNFVRLLYGSTEKRIEKLNKQTFSLVLYKGESFDAGKYVIAVESRLGSAVLATDADDFIVGNIVIKSKNGKKIKAGRVGARTP